MRVVEVGSGEGKVIELVVERVVFVGIFEDFLRFIVLFLWMYLFFF